MAYSILDRVNPSDIRREGFPHVVVAGALPETYYQELADSFPSLGYVTDVGNAKNNQAYRKIALETAEDPAVPDIWREFIAHHCSPEFFAEVCEFWGADVAATHPRLAENFGKPLQDFTVGVRRPGKGQNPENLTHDVMLDCQISYNSPVRSLSTVRGPHLDSPFKLYAALLYFRHPDDPSTGGDLDIYRLREGRQPRPRPGKIDPHNVERVATVPYRANTLIMWINSPAALHGVTPRSVTEVPRRYMNFLGECYRGQSDDFFIASDAPVDGFWHRLKRFRRRFKRVPEVRAPAADGTPPPAA